ncbi:MAG: MATE family efflux transporter [Ruminiclostridium sp.]|nr:MATE family efflux transporter [Ruminiclostridium sp.]
MKPVSAPPQGNPLGTAPLGPLIYKFAVPSIIAMLVGSVYNITDQIFIGQVVGMLGNAATNVVFPLVSLSIAMSQLVGVGLAANFNLSLGAKQEEDAKAFVGTGLTLVTLVGILFTVAVLLFETPILRLCGATDTVLPYAREYLSITVWGMPFVIFANGVYPVIRADRSPKVAMTSSLVGAGLNIFLDWLFMFPLGMGIRGAAIATVISQVVSFLICLAYFPKFKTFPIERASLGIQKTFATRILKLGTASFANHMVMTLVNVVLNNTLVYYGALSIYGSDIPLAVAGVVGKVNAIMISFVVGLAHGCQPILSFNMGAKNYSRVKGTFQRALAVGLVFSFGAFALFQLFPHQVLSIFGTGEELYFQFGEDYLQIYLLMVGLFGIQPLAGNYFTSIGEVKQSLFLSVSRQGFLLLPLLIILPLIWGLDGVLYAGPIADFLAVVLAGTMVVRSFRKLDRLAAEET